RQGGDALVCPCWRLAPQRFATTPALTRSNLEQLRVRDDGGRFDTKDAPVTPLGPVIRVEFPELAGTADPSREEPPGRCQQLVIARFAKRPANRQAGGGSGRALTDRPQTISRTHRMGSR